MDAINYVVYNDVSNNPRSLFELASLAVPNDITIISEYVPKPLAHEVINIKEKIKDKQIRFIETLIGFGGISPDEGLEIIDKLEGGSNIEEYGLSDD